MRTVVLCATLAALTVPSSVGAQSLPLTESDALSRLSGCGPMAESGPRGTRGWRPRESQAKARVDAFLVALRNEIDIHRSPRSEFLVGLARFD